MNAAHPPASSGRAAYTPRWGSTTKRARRCSGLVRSRSWTPVMAVLSYWHGNGQPAEAQAKLAEFEPLAASGRYASPYAVGVVHAGLGDREQTLSSLAKANHERSHGLVAEVRSAMERDPIPREVSATRPRRGAAASVTRSVVCLPTENIDFSGRVTRRHETQPRLPVCGRRIE